jgi:hypothetical protein
LERIALLRHRVRMGLNLAVAAILLFAAADLWVGDSTLAPLVVIKLVGLATLGAVALRLRGVDQRRRLVGLALFSAAAIMAGTALSGIVMGDALTAPIICAVICMVTAAVVPWGTRPQLLTAAFGVAAIYLTTLVLGAAVGYPALASILGCAASVPIAGELARRREMGARAQREEAEVSATLARVGDQLTLELNKPDTLLLRTCRLVATGLGPTSATPSCSKTIG